MEVFLSQAFGGIVSSSVHPSSRSYNSGLSLNINPNHLTRMKGEGDEEGDFDIESMIPSHFYGELAKTDLGCRVLAECGHVNEFARFIRQHGLEAADADLIFKLKSVLWAVVWVSRLCWNSIDVGQGNIGASEGGLPLIEEEDIVGRIVEIATQSLVLSVRG